VCVCVAVHVAACGAVRGALTCVRAPEASETMVAEIIHDIASLDNAKRNLTSAITALKRLQMLESGVAQVR
jgi:hypothetical protein